jgi:hypothetical protein
LAAAEFAGGAASDFTGESDTIEELRDFAIALRAGEASLDYERLTDNFEGGPARIERTRGILEDELNIRIDFATLLFGERRKIDVFEPDAS